MDLSEHVEDVVDFVRRNANPRVRYGDRHFTTRMLGDELDATLARRVFCRVIEQIGQNLSQAVGIGVQPQRLIGTSGG